ncbi:MAG: hypothetical protein DRJ03_26345 [Chloroflexi bacterium]|nr:MAG: hypothetical protein DRJ03_26345 [Chloroflexota bacterium]
MSGREAKGREGAMKAILRIYRHERGRKVLEREEKLNTFVHNFGKLLEAILRRAATTDETHTTDLVSSTGETKTVVVKSPNGTDLFTYTSGQYSRTYIHLGTSSQTPTRDDYGPVSSYARVDGDTLYADGAVKISGSHTPSADTTIREVCLEKEFYVSADAANRIFCLLRAVISDFTMYANTTYTIEITISLS